MNSAAQHPPVQRSESDGLGVVVLGMHRSGTSLSSRLFGALGCSYGGALMPAKSDNAEGFYEHQEIVRIHDDFLAETHRTWADPRPWTEENFTSTAADRAKGRLAEVFARDFQHRSLWVIKDPRMCRLLPLWRDVWSSAGHRVAYFHTVRNPLAVASSLETRNGFGREGSLFLWLRHVLESERFTRGSDRAWAALDDLAHDPLGQLRKACRRMEIESHFDLRAASAALMGSVRKDRIHHVAREDELPDWPWVADTRRAVVELLEGEDAETYRTLDRVRDQVQQADTELHYAASVGLLGEILAERLERSNSLERVVEDARRHVGKLDTELTDRQKELDRGIAHRVRLEAQIVEGKEYVSRLEGEIEAKNSYLRELEDRVRSLESRLDRTED